MSPCGRMFGGALLFAWAAVAGAADRFETEVGAGALHEHCFAVAQGGAFTWSFEAGGPLRFNIHRHAGDTVIYPVGPLTATQLAGHTVADAAADYCMMWENPGAEPVRLRGESRLPG